MKLQIGDMISSVSGNCAIIVDSKHNDTVYVVQWNNERLFHKEIKEENIKLMIQYGKWSIQKRNL